MATITVSVTAAEKAWLQQLAVFHGISLSNLLLTYSIDQLEDWYDSQIANVAYKSWENQGGESVGMAEVLRLFDNPDRK